MTRCPEQVAVGALVLGSLAPGERHRLQAHIDHCAVCANELADLADLPALLARVPARQILSARVEPSEGGFQRLRAAAATRRRDTWRLRTLAVAAAVVVLAGAGIGLTFQAVHPPVRASVVTASAGTVHARATLTGTDTGTQIVLSLTGVPAEQRCQLVAVAADGRREIASTWTATYTGAATVTGSSSLHPHGIHRLLVETLDGHTLLTLPASPT